MGSTIPPRVLSLSHLPSAAACDECSLEEATLDDVLFDSLQ